MGGLSAYTYFLISYGRFIIFINLQPALSVLINFYFRVKGRK